MTATQTTIVISSNDHTDHPVQNASAAITQKTQLKDIGKKLTKLMYSSTDSPKTRFENTTIIVVLPELISNESDIPCKGRLARGEKCSCIHHSINDIISLQNSIKHIVRHGIKHGIDIKIQ